MWEGSETKTSNMKNSIIKNTIVTIAAILTMGLSSYAGFPPSFGDDVVDNNSSSSSNDLPAIPLDGGLSILLAAGAAYGVKKRMKK